MNFERTNILTLYRASETKPALRSATTRVKRFTLAALSVGTALIGVAPAASAATGSPGYWLAGGDGGIFSYGSAPFYGSIAGQGATVVGVDTNFDAATGANPSYDMVTSTGQVFECSSTCGPAPNGSLPPGQDGTVVGIAERHAGYWITDSTGNVYPFGDAQSYGSLAGYSLAAPVTGIAAYGSTGYWLVAADGGVFTFGDATFYGSMGNIKLNQRIVGIAPTADAKGYWLVGADGGVFAFGDAEFYGSAANLHLRSSIVGIRPTPDGGGYWLVASDGGVFTYGDAPFLGSAGNIKLDRPVVGMAIPCFAGGPTLCSS